MCFKAGEICAASPNHPFLPLGLASWLGGGCGAVVRCGLVFVDSQPLSVWPNLHHGRPLFLSRVPGQSVRKFINDQLIAGPTTVPSLPTRC